jgi:hypothetical protein
MSSTTLRGADGIQGLKPTYSRLAWAATPPYEAPVSDVPGQDVGLARRRDATVNGGTAALGWQSVVPGLKHVCAARSRLLISGRGYQSEAIPPGLVRLGDGRPAARTYHMANTWSSDICQSCGGLSVCAIERWVVDDSTHIRPITKYEQAPE